MALKKPSDFFGKDSNNKKEILVSKEQKIPENFDAYKDNLKNVKVLNEFTENFGSFSENIEKINLLEESILELKEEVKNTLSQEDLDNAMMSNLLVLEENIINIQNNLEGINQQNLQEIYEEVESVISDVEKIADQLPVYNNLIKSNEISLDKKLITYQKRVQEELTNFDNTIDDKFELLERNLEGINEGSLNEISSQVSDLNDFVNTEVKKYKNQVVEQSIQIDEKISSFEQKLLSDFENHQNELKEEIVRVNESVQSFIESEVPKYQHLLTNVKIENDEKVQEIVDKFSHKIKSLTENAQRLNDEVENKSKILDESFTSEIKKLEEHILNVKKEAEETSSTYKKLYNVIEAKGLRDTNQFSNLEGVISNLSDEIKSVYTKIEETKEYFEGQETALQESYQETIKEVQNQFSKKFNLLENDIETKNKKIKDANEIIAEDLISLKEKVESLPKLQKDYNNIQKKINFIEETFNKINEKTLLKEDGSLLTGSEKEITKDPLTPLDKNFVTFDDLSNHYRQFINRVQIQLASIGGGGETRLEFLDDIDRSTAKINGRFLKYDAASDKWVGAVGGGGGSQTLDDTLGLGNTSSIGMSVGIVTATSFIGSGSNLTGIVTSITAGSGVSIDQSTGNVTITATGGSGGGESYWTSTSSGIHTLSNVGIGTTAKSDFKLFVEGDARITGILTIGSQSVTIDGSNNTIKVGSGITIDGNTGIISASAVYIAGSQVSTFSGNYNDLTNKPDLSTISVAYASTAGIATYATNAGVTTALQNSRTFEITGDIVASPISFDGTGNVSLAANIQPNSVALGGDTTGDYVQTITGTSNQITVTSGTGEGSSPTLSIPSQFTIPQDVEIIRDLQVNRNLNVNGNITIGGTSATLFSQELKIFDPDIVLGFRTDAFGNDVSNENTANHGGIAIASTEGNPLVQLFIAGIETNPATYKKIMWFKSGEFSGLGTDAWLSNYAVGIGSTQFPTGTRLAAGSVQFTENDLAVVRNINASGVVTSTTFVGALIGTATTSNNLTDAANITAGTINSARLSGTYNINVSYASNAGIATVSEGLIGTPNITVGIVTATSFVKSGGTSSQFLKADGSVDTGTYLTTTGSGTNLTGIVTSIVAGTNVTISGSTGQVTINATGGGGSTLGIATAGGTVGTGVTLLDFRGAGISTVTVSSGIATINIEGGGSSTPEISSVMMSMIF